MNRLRPAGLRSAIDTDALSLHYQPQVNVPARRLSGVEGFVRWPHPALGMLGPGEIVPLVEEGLLHVVFDRWVIRSLCAQVVAWRKQSVLVSLVAANIWPQTLRHPTFASMVREALDEADADPTMLEIQLPPGALVSAPEIAAVNALRAMRIRLASDDFARGLEPAIRSDTLTIPRGASAEIAGSVVAAAEGTAARVVAEGVESVAERDALVAMGCAVIQGYVDGPKVTAGDIRAMVV